LSKGRFRIARRRPETFKETAQWKPTDGWKIAEPHDEALRGKWWELYGDSKLNELEEQVEPSNQTLRIADANFRQARGYSLQPSRIGSDSLGRSRYFVASDFRKSALFPFNFGKWRNGRVFAACRPLL
jgi:outer membrane protein TolC